MSFLSPLFLTLAAAVAVPLLIHLMRRRIGARVEFPAARYLQRAEREHSRTLRLRNLLLMLLRAAAVLLIAAAAARPVARWFGAGHAPTALAIVVDNTLSSSAVVGGRPMLDRFREMAGEALGRATTADRLWLVTADGRLRGGTAAMLRDELARLEPLAGGGDLPLALTRAAGAVRASGLDARQVAVLTDGQRTTWENPGPLPGVQVLLWVPPLEEAPPRNRAVQDVAARPERWTPRGTIAARLLATDSTSYRIDLGDRTLVRGTAAPDEEILVRAAPALRGWLAGRIEIEPDELPGDNVRHFAVWVGPAPGVHASAGAGPFVAEALEVLRRGNRVTAGRDVAVASADELGAEPAALILPPADPVRLGAANRALERSAIPWRFGPRRTGAVSLRGDHIGEAEASVRYDLIPQAGAVAETLVVAGREPWAVAGPRYVLAASPLVPEATSLPVRASFVPWLAAIVTERLAGEPGGIVHAEPGERADRPRWADALETVEGRRERLEESFDAPSRPGTYFYWRGDRRVGALVVNPAPEESVLDRFGPAELASRLQADRVLTAPEPPAWPVLAFRAAARRSLLEPVLLALLTVLIIEALVVASGTRRTA